MMSKVSGASTGRVGCRPLRIFQALYLTPATASPTVPVEVIGIARPLQAITCRSGLKPSTRTCSRSTEGST